MLLVTLTMKLISAYLASLLFLILAISFKSEACIKKPPESVTKLPNFILNQSIHHNFTIVDSNTTCNQTTEPNKTVLHCFNDGKCLLRILF